MKRLVVTTIGTVALGLALAAPAYADDGAYYDALQAGGIEPNEAALNMGQAVCNEIAAGGACTGWGQANGCLDPDP